MTNALTKEQFTGVWNEWLAARQNQADDATETARIGKKAKDMGVDVDAMKLAAKCRKMTSERRSDFLENFAIYLRWAGLPNQLRLDLDADPTVNPFEEDERPEQEETVAAEDVPEEEQPAYAKGWNDALAGQPYDHDAYPKDTAGATFYYHGWNAGQAQMVEGLRPNGDAAGEAHPDA